MKKQSSFSSSFEQKEKGKVLALWAETQTVWAQLLEGGNQPWRQN